VDGHLTTYPRESLDSGPNAVVPDNLMESIDAINAFKEENC